MPIFGYRCKDCETEFEILYRSPKDVAKEEPDEVCPKCDSKKKERLINTKTSFQLKGGGWAKDKYGK
jgi:putative FmdB family regulatory protein